MGFEITPDMNKEIAARVAIEGRVARKVIKAALALGYLISVHDGEEVTVSKSRDAKAIEDAMFTTDEDTLLIHIPNGKRIGNIFFVYGNDGWDVINDYSFSLESMMDPIYEWIDRNECF